MSSGQPALCGLSNIQERRLRAGQLGKKRRQLGGTARTARNLAKSLLSPLAAADTDYDRRDQACAVLAGFWCAIIVLGDFQLSTTVSKNTSRVGSFSAQRTPGYAAGGS